MDEDLEKSSNTSASSAQTNFRSKKDTATDIEKAKRDSIEQAHRDSLAAIERELHRAATEEKARKVREQKEQQQMQGGIRQVQKPDSVQEESAPEEPAKGDSVGAIKQIAQ